MSNLLTQEDLSWAKIRPKFKSEKQALKGGEPASQTAILAEKEAALAEKKDASVVAVSALSWDQLLLPTLAVVLVSLLAGYKFGQQSTPADLKLQGEELHSSEGHPICKS